MGVRAYIEKKLVQAVFRQLGSSSYNGSAPFIYPTPYNGEKNAGELGAVKEYMPDFQVLAARSWQAYTESDIAQLIIGNFLLWVVGTGLKFKAEPAIDILTQAEISVDIAKFIKLAESRFNLHMDSRRSTNTRSETFHQLVYEAKKHAIVSGDVLVMLDYGRPTDKNKAVSARMIDGSLVQTPFFDVNRDTKNPIFHGVEINQYGEPVAYWISLPNMQFQRVEAYTKTGTLQAFLIYGTRYRVDIYRGMPLLSAVLETIKKMDRYKEATVGSAEERAKIPFSVEHAQYSTGEDPLTKLKAAAGHGADTGTQQITNELLAATASNIRYTSGKTVFNMPIGATLKPLDNKNDLYFKDFFTINFEFLCATLGIPPEVALNKYTSSFSSSRGANKNWEHKVNFERESIDLQLYQPFYNFWLEMEIYNDRIVAPGYTVAKFSDDYLLVEAYQKCRFIGAKMPFIDPVKEVAAVRAKLGDQTTPLTTYEQAAEELALGDWTTMINQSHEERELAISLGFTPSASASTNPEPPDEPADSEE